MFKSLSHFKFIFMYGKRLSSNFIDLHAAVQLYQHHLLKRHFPLYVLASFVKDLPRVYGFIYGLSVLFCWFLPHCFDYGNFVVLSEVWEHHASFFFSSQDCFGNSGSFMVPYNFFFIICPSSVWRVVFKFNFTLVPSVGRNLVGIRKRWWSANRCFIPGSTVTEYVHI